MGEVAVCPPIRDDGGRKRGYDDQVDYLMNVIRSMAVVLGVLLAISAFFKVLGKWRWTSWLWRHNVSGPLAEWISRTIRVGAEQFHDEVSLPLILQLTKDVAEIRHELVANGGESLHDTVIALRARTEILEEWMRVQIAAGTVTP